MVNVLCWAAHGEVVGKEENIGFQVLKLYELILSRLEEVTALGLWRLGCVLRRLILPKA